MQQAETMERGGFRVEQNWWNGNGNGVLAMSPAVHS